MYQSQFPGLDIPGFFSGTAGKVGNVLSSRLPIRYRDADGNTVTGFFTTNELVDARQIARTRGDALVRSAAETYPELFSFYDRLKDSNAIYGISEVLLFQAVKIGYETREYRRLATLKHDRSLREVLMRQMLMLGFLGDRMDALHKDEEAGKSPTLTGLLDAMFAVVKAYMESVNLKVYGNSIR